MQVTEVIVAIIVICPTLVYDINDTTTHSIKTSQKDWIFAHFESVAFTDFSPLIRDIQRIDELL